jgi:hypothetical protein
MSADGTIDQNPTFDADDFPRYEAARLVSVSLRPSRFLLVLRCEDEVDGFSEIRNYGVDYPDSVPVVDNMDPMIQDMVSDHLRLLLPNGGVICVPPPDHLLCTVCRIGVRSMVTVTTDGSEKEVCDSCAMGIQQTTGVAATPIAKSDEEPTP